jgi:hypothetical protein
MLEQVKVCMPLTTEFLHKTLAKNQHMSVSELISFCKHETSTLVVMIYCTKIIKVDSE